jgi:pilus assembly protein Flp/PilA
MTKLYSFLKDESGVTAIEYGLIAAGIGVAIVVIVGQVGSALVDTFTTVESNLNEFLQTKRSSHRFGSI